MAAFLSILYGFFIVALVYFFSYLSVRGFMAKGSMPIYLVIGKYFVYWKVIVLGFKYLPAWGIITGMISGTYISLPIWYWINKRYFS